MHLFYFADQIEPIVQQSFCGRISSFSETSSSDQLRRRLDHVICYQIDSTASFLNLMN